MIISGFCSSYWANILTYCVVFCAQGFSGKAHSTARCDYGGLGWESLIVVGTKMASMATMSTRAPRPKSKSSTRSQAPTKLPVLHVLQCILILLNMVRLLHGDTQPTCTPGTLGGGTHLPATPLLSVHLVMPNPTDSKIMIVHDPCGPVAYMIPSTSYLTDKALPFTLLMLAGDIQTNPGPANKGKKRTHRQRRPSTPDCPTCKQPVT